MTEQAAKCVLKLNTPVLNVLFPEGTEARVQLQQAVLAEVSRTFVKNSLSADVQAYLRTLSNEVSQEIDVKSVVQKYFETSAAWNSTTKLKPGTGLVKAIATAAENALSDQFYQTLNDRIEAQVKEYTDRLDSRVEYAVKQRIDRLTTDAINARVNAAVDAARAAL